MKYFGYRLKRRKRVQESKTRSLVAAVSQLDKGGAKKALKKIKQSFSIIELAMSKQNQVEKNILLSSKFSTYLENKPDVLDKISANAQYVVLSANDKELNKMNELIINSLKKMGKKVVKVQETNNPETPWELTPLPL